MTDQRELDRVLAAFFVDGTDEVADRVIDAALDQVGRTRQRRAIGLPRRFQAMPMFTRVAVAAVIGVLAFGGTLALFRPGQSGVGDSSPPPAASTSPTGPSPTPTLLPSLTGPMTTGRQIHTATPLADGRVLIAGGYTGGDATLASAELYDPATDAFSATGSLADGRGLHTATLLTDGRVLVAGGGPASWLSAVGPFLASAEIYDPATGTFSPTGSMTTAREHHTATLLADGRVLITGGNDVGSHGLASAELYDPRTGTFSATGEMTTARGFHTATLLADGRVLIAGGDAAAWADAGPFLDSAEIYDPATGTFAATGSMTGSMTGGRAHHAATLLTDGRVLITGGVLTSGTLSLDSAELFDPGTGTFSPTGTMTEMRVYHTATLLTDGAVLITGGLAHGRVYAMNTEFLASAEVYDPETSTFTATDAMTDGRSYHAATVLADGRVLVTAGYGASSDAAPLASAEIYDPMTGTFGPAGDGR